MLGTINIWLLIGIIFAVGYNLWQVTTISKLLGQYIIINNVMMQELDKMLQERDQAVDKKIEDVEDKLEYMNDKNSIS